MTVNPHSIDLSAFVAEHLKRAEPDLLRSMLSSFIQALMSAEADAVCCQDAVMASHGLGPEGDRE
jgi:putative transposase